MPGDVSGNATSAVPQRYRVLRHQRHTAVWAVNIAYLFPSFQYLLNRFTDYSKGFVLSLSGVQYEILKSLAQKADFDLKIETIKDTFSNSGIEFLSRNS
jgi:putative salt-induced outer membrane protein YdiY